LTDNILVWDLETIPDLQGYARANALFDQSPSEIREHMGDGFPKLIYHRIVCVGALLASPAQDGYEVRAIDASPVGELTEKEVISSFLGIVDKLAPKMVTFNGSSFDLPVLRYRAMVHGLSAPGFEKRPYFHQYRDEHVDLCDVLSSFSYGGRAKLDEMSRIMGLAGKPDGMDGSRVEEYFNAGRIGEIADYCLSDVVDTYRLWLRYELFRRAIDERQFEWSDQYCRGRIADAAE
jgi:predicted PolB exonuclease-like 3'-5' exonuclease